ncbi:asparaginyl-tRNA synthetase [Actinokineospora baliensis]|uniref:asparagine synthetase A n=1 Tax=Actinokineospora baliensis TaxID=547056 RepID=UPI00195D91E0|nr:asparagine synthetase A [Actinokineospora baliensis]MBM7775490.1 asparaginyl-tRNA synthetase [Actinokineospora baliensis]
MNPLPPPAAEHLSSPVTRAALRVAHRAMAAARALLDGEGFTELPLPVIGPVTDPGARGAKQVDVDYYGHRYKLMTSGILYKQAALLGFDRLYSIAANVRAEPPETAATNRHLVEFHQIDVEIAQGDRDTACGIVERLLTHVVQHVVETAADELAELGREVSVLEKWVRGPMDAITHREAVDRLRALGYQQNSGTEIEWAGERLLSDAASRPFFIVDYPKGSRGFYDRESATAPGSLRNFDLIAPGGFGELVSGSERESDYGRIIARMRETGENPAKYGWYLDVLRGGVPVSAGFGMGLQRLVRALTGLGAVWQVTAFPKLPGVAAP